MEKNKKMIPRPLEPPSVADTKRNKWKTIAAMPAEKKNSKLFGNFLLWN